MNFFKTCRIHGKFYIRTAQTSYQFNIFDLEKITDISIFVIHGKVKEFSGCTAHKELYFKKYDEAGKFCDWLNAQF